MTMMRIVDGNEDSIQVEITTEIRNGQLLRINASEAFLGIESGVIQVLCIMSNIDIDPDLGMVDGIPTEDLIQVIESHKDGMLDLMEGTEYYGEELRRLNNDPWVVYRYQRNDGWNVLPLEEFVGHTMHY